MSAGAAPPAPADAAPDMPPPQRGVAAFPSTRTVLPPLDSMRADADSRRVLPTRATLVLARRLAALAMLVLALGLPRFFVLCSAGGDSLHVEFVHAPGACCAPDAASELAAMPTPVGALTPAPESCDHVEFATDLAPAPRSGDAAAAAPPALLAVLPLPAPAAPRESPAATRPPATGPPPWRDRLRQQATVRLQV